MKDESSDSYFDLKTDVGVLFDESGNLYYMTSEWKDSTSINTVYKFDPKANETTLLTAPAGGTSYTSFKISKDGKIIFVEGNRWNAGSSSASNGTYVTFLRAIPVENPNYPSNIY